MVGGGNGHSHEFHIKYGSTRVILSQNRRQLDVKSESLLLRGFSWLFCYSDLKKLTNLKSD